MTQISEIIERMDRGINYYDSSNMIRRYQGIFAARKRAAAKAAAAASKAKTAKTAADKAAVAAHRARVRNRRGVRAHKKGAHRKGGVNGSTGQFISQTGYHTASAKQTRSSARQSQARKLSTRKYGRYSQLM